MSAIFEVIDGASALAGVPALQLSGQFFTRKLDMGGDWTSIRILMRCGWYYQPSVGNFQTVLAFGMTSNKKHINDPNCDCLGVYIFQTFQVGSNQVTYIWNDGAGSPFLFHKVNGVTSSGVVGSTGTRLICIWPNVRCLGLDVVRTATSFTMTQVSTLASSQTSMTRSQFYAGLEQPTSNTTYGTNVEGSSVTPAGTYTGTGPLDSVWVWVSREIPPLMIADMAVCRYA